MRDLLIEIGTEELPPKALKRLSNVFAETVYEELKAAELAPGDFKRYAAPRRLAVLVEGLLDRQEDREVERRGPSFQAAFDDQGNPTKAAEGFARSCGVEVGDLGEIRNDKGAWLAHRFTETGKTAEELIPAIVDKALAALPIPKRMRWADRDVEFVRPVHWVVMLFGDAVIDTEILGIPAGRESRGHRFHHPDPLYISEPAAYAPLLESEGHVMPDFAARREAIKAQAEEAASRLGGRALIEEDLLDEVTGLVEWPVAVTGSFDAGFLEIPAEALISSMQDHQKYFPVLDEQGELMPHFVTIANIDSADPAQVSAGNERVIRPRLADADFFWKQDRKRPLADRRQRLASVVFQKRLGTLEDKTARLVSLSGAIAAKLGADTRLAGRAAELAKCDLMTEMVNEFADLQGTMGRYYAEHDGEPEEVAEALEEQYPPAQAGDPIPETATGRILALADRLDTLMGIFAIGQKPTGEKDPFGLRRAALGMLRILIEGELDLDLRDLLELGAENLRNKVDAAGAVEDAFDFMLDRLKAYYLDRGVRFDVFDAVVALRPSRPLDFDRRIRAVSEFLVLPESESLSAANKRIRNILRKSEEAIPGSVDDSLLEAGPEQALADRVEAIADQVTPMLDRGEYEPALQALAGLREDVDAFFDEVMVMAEDEALRRNRLALLKRLGDLFLRAADISRLHG